MWTWVGWLIVNYRCTAKKIWQVFILTLQNDSQKNVDVLTHISEYSFVHADPFGFCVRMKMSQRRARNWLKKKLAEPLG